MSLFKNKGSSEGIVGNEPHNPAPVAPASGSREPIAKVRHQQGGEMANIGKSITIKGDVVGDEDLVIDGRIEGRIELKESHLTIGPNGDVKAEIEAKQVTIVGKVAGNVNATERVEIRESGRLAGDLTSPRLLIHEGAQINGSISMKASSSLGATPSVTPQKLEPPKAKQAG
jgi:cytoskeletal protein CcmA (bactofilin family)